MKLLLLVHLAAPSAVENLTLTFMEGTADDTKLDNTYSVDVIVTWELPVEPNGIISDYQYTIESSGGVIIASGSTIKMSVTQTVILSPYTNYTVSVQANNSVGPGQEAMQTTLSPEAGKQFK